MYCYKAWNEPDAHLLNPSLGSYSVQRPAHPVLVTFFMHSYNADGVMLSEACAAGHSPCTLLRWGSIPE